MVTSEKIDEINGLLDEGNTSFSSVCNLIDGDREVALQFIRQATIKKLACEENVDRLKKELDTASALVSLSHNAIQHSVNFLKLEYPFTIGYGKDIALFREDGSIEVLPLINR